MGAVKRIVSTSFWTDSKVDEFTPEDKYFMLYLLTNPFTTQLGIYELSVKQAAFQMGYSQEAVMALIDRFQNKYHMILYSKKTGEVALLNYLRHSIVKGGKPVEDCIRKDLLNVKDKSLITEVFKHIEDSNDLNVTVKKIVSQYLNENDNDKENDNDNDNERIVHDSYHDSYHESEDDPDQSVRKVIPYDSVKAMYNEICGSYPRCISLSEQRKRAIKARFNSGYTLGDFENLFRKAEASSFLKGKNDRNWTATFDWMIKDANMAKVLDGNYDDKEGKNGKNSDSFSKYVIGTNL